MQGICQAQVSGKSAINRVFSEGLYQESGEKICQRKQENKILM